MKRVLLFSVGGYHPSTGELSYSNYQGFSSASAADAWKSTQLGWSSQETISHPADAVPLRPGLPLGSLVYWDTVGGKSHFGWLKEYDNGTAMIRMDEQTRAVRA
jgi:hypothetical protein